MTRIWMVATVAAAVWLVAGSPARAGLLPVSYAVTPESGQFRWTYSIVLPTDAQIKKTSNRKTTSIIGVIVSPSSELARFGRVGIFMMSGGPESRSNSMLKKVPGTLEAS